MSYRLCYLPYQCDDLITQPSVSWIMLTSEAMQIAVPLRRSYGAISWYCSRPCCHSLRIDDINVSVRVL